MNRFVVDGTDYSDCADQLESLKLKYKFQLKRQYVIESSTEIILEKKGAEYIKQKFCDGCESIRQRCSIRIWKVCLGKWLNFQVAGSKSKYAICNDSFSGSM